MFTDRELKSIADAFVLEGTYAGSEAIKEGHINNTFKLIMKSGTGGSAYLLQQINTSVFKNPALLMENVAAVTAFLAEKLASAPESGMRSLRCIPCRAGGIYHTDEKGRVWRIYNYIDNVFSYSCTPSTSLFYKTGSAFGAFMNLLADFPAEKLGETIPDFHNTAVRFRNLTAAIGENRSGRLDTCTEEIAFARARADDTYILTGKAAAGLLPLRVTHNDTKLNNILFDKDTDAPVCVVDLDTVMPGLSLYDFGDAIRSGANTAAEDAENPAEVSLSVDLYTAYLRGFLEAAGESLWREEVRLLPFSAKLMTFECGMRFLTDYLDGDVYFRTAYPTHNLVRARAQFALVKDIEKKMALLDAITAETYREITGKTLGEK